MDNLMQAAKDRAQQSVSLHDGLTFIARISAALAVFFAVSLTPLDAAHARGVHVRLSSKISTTSKKLVTANLMVAHPHHASAEDKAK